ncbi:hypothetical protein Tco_0788028, partial [Tanacetum coccineum]
GSETRIEGSSKIAGEELESENLKKQKRMKDGILSNHNSLWKFKEVLINDLDASEY